MIILTKKNTLKVKLGAAPSSEAQFYLAYSNSANNTLGASKGVTDGTNDVTMLHAPQQSIVHVEHLTVYNPNATGITVTVTIDTTILVQLTVGANETLANDGEGWYIVGS